MQHVSIVKIDAAAWLDHIMLRGCSMGAQGLYVNLLALSATSPTPRELRKTDGSPMATGDVARVLHVGVKDWSGWQKELLSAGVIRLGKDGQIELPVIDVPSRPRPAKKVATVQPDFEPKFAEFWQVYPRKTAIAPARKAFYRLASEGLADKIIAAIKKQAPDFMAKEPQYRPHPASWLNARRFEDEPDAPQVQPAIAFEPQYRQW